MSDDATRCRNCGSPRDEHFKGGDAWSCVYAPPVPAFLRDVPISDVPVPDLEPRVRRGQFWRDLRHLARWRVIAVDGDDVTLYAPVGNTVQMSAKKMLAGEAGLVLSPERRAAR